MNDSGVIRTKFKVTTAIENAGTILRLQEEFGSQHK
ncbi:DNA-3-methyladenine glycosylase I [Mucilaginibacter polytrichastri]|nr:DNA-3-methyladenine glycosylase I [Mucilaginibacter polytrichastri]